LKIQRQQIRFAPTNSLPHKNGKVLLSDFYEIVCMKVIFVQKRIKTDCRHESRTKWKQKAM